MSEFTVIKIERCGSPNYWYKNLVGEYRTVKKQFRGRHVWGVEDILTTWHISPHDFVIPDLLPCGALLEAINESINDGADYIGLEKYTFIDSDDPHPVTWDDIKLIFRLLCVLTDKVDKERFTFEFSKYKLNNGFGLCVAVNSLENAESVYLIYPKVKHDKLTQKFFALEVGTNNLVEFRDLLAFQLTWFPSK